MLVGFPFEINEGNLVKGTSKEKKVFFSILFRFYFVF